MGGERVQRREREAQEQAPVAVVPTRRVADERQAAELRSRHQSVVGEINALVRYSREIRVPPTGRTLADIEAECDRFAQALQRMNLTDVPILGSRYRDEVRLVSDTVDAARRDARAGNIGSAVNRLGAARDQLGKVGEVFGLQVSFQLGGVPQNIIIEGVEPAQAFDLVMGALEDVIRDAGTQNEGRYRVVIRAARLYADPANLQAYNADNPEVRRERDNLFAFILRRGRQARAGEAYTADMAREDELLLRSFEQNIASIRTQVGAHNTQVLTQWRDALTAMMAQESEEGGRRRLTSLRDELDAALRRLREGQAIAGEEMRTLANRYYLLTGRTPPLSEDERRDMLGGAARDLRGTARTVRDATAEWFGEQALAAIREGNMEIAALAVAMGMLERSSSGSAQGARDYISSYWQIHDTIAQRRPATPGMMSSFASQIELSTVLADADRLVRDFARGGTQEKRERVTRAAGIVRERMRRGDIEGARRLLEMARTYGSLLTEHSFRAWTGSPEMEGALDSELQGQDAGARFANAAVHYRFSSEITGFRRAIADWGRGLAAQKRVVEDALGRVEALAAEGNAREAQRVLTLIVMYADAVERLGVRGAGGIVTSISQADQRTARGMESALGALVQGQATVDAREIETVFMESFNAAQRAYVDREATRFEAFARERSVGRDVVTEAIRTARQRAERGDYRGALTLLQFVQYFYGEPTGAVAAAATTPMTSARSQGWRYAIFASRGSEAIAGYTGGRQDMLDAIRMEMNADSQQAHLAAAQLLDRGSFRIAQTEQLQNDRMPLYRRYMGLDPFVVGQADTRGRLPLGERRTNGTYPDYLDLATVRDYERTHPEDTQVSAGPTLQQLLDRLTDAANRGDLRAYNSAREAFSTRFQIVASRAARSRSLESARTQLRDLEASVRELRGLYGATPPAEVATRLDALERRRADLATRLTAMRGTTAEIPAAEYSRLLVDYDRERRLAVAYSVVGGQIDLNDQYRRMVGMGAGQLMSFARTFLDESRPHLVAAREALARGDMATAAAEYREGIYKRRCALGVYNAENALTLTRSDSWTTGLSEMWTFITDNDEYWRRSAPPGQSYPQYEGYEHMHTDAFHDILYGEGTRDERTRIERMMNAGRMVELSVFPIPADNMSQVLSNYVPDQRRLATLARDAVTAARAGNQAESERLLREADTLWRSMSQRAEDNQWWGNVAATVAALGISLIPGGGWVVGGAIFTTMAFDRVVTEYNMNGEASTEAWAMLALSVGTMGLGGAAALTRTAALTAEAAGATNAARLMTASRALTYTTLGVGLFFSGYMGGQAIAAFSEGRTRDGVLLTGMALFPFAHMAGARAWEGMGRPRAGARGAGAELPAVLDEVGPSARRPAIDIDVTETAQARRLAELRSPSRLFEFLRDFIGRDAAGRTALLATLPESARPAIARLAELPVVRTALDAGVLNEVALSAMRRTISTFEGPNPTPGGPRGTRPDWEFSTWVQGPSGAESFRGFLGDLMVPDNAPTARLNARDIARGRLEALRAANPDAAGLIDGLLRNPTVRDAVLTGHDTPLSVRMIGEVLNGRPLRPAQRGRPAQAAVPGLRQMIPDEVVAAERQATAAYQQELQMAVGYEAPRIDAGVPGAAGPEGMARAPPIRGMAGEGGGRPGAGGGEVVPGRVQPGETGGRVPETGGREPRPGGARQGAGRGPRAPAEEAPARAPGEEEAAAAAAEGGTRRVEVVRVGALRQMGRWVAGRFRGWRETRAARAQAPPTPEEFAANARRALEDTLGSAARPEEIPTVIEEAVRGLDTAAQAEVAGAVRTAPQRIADIMKSLWHRANERGTPRAQREQAWRTLTRLFAPENARAALESLARTDPELATILRQTDAAIVRGARGARISVENFRTRLAQQGLGEDVMFVVETIERTAAEPLSRARAQAREIETATIPGLDRQLADARANPRLRAAADAQTRIRVLESEIAAERQEAQRAPEGSAERQAAEQRVRDYEAELARSRASLSSVLESRAYQRAAARVEALEGQLQAARGDLANIHAMLADPARAPLTTTERLFGMRLSAAERGPVLANLQDAGVIPADAILLEVIQAGRRAAASLNGIDAAGDPVAQAMKSVMERSLTRSSEPLGTSLDETLLAALRSDEVAGAVGRRHGAPAEQAFRDAVREGTLEEVLGRLSQQPLADSAAGVSGFARSARAALGDDFALMTTLGGRATSAIGAGTDLVGTTGAEFRGMGQRFGDWWAQSWARGTLRWFFRSPVGEPGTPQYGEYSRFTQYYLRAGREILRTTPEGMPMARLGGWMRMGLQVAIWGTEAYLLSGYVRDIYRTLTGAPSVEEGIRRCEREFGFRCSPETARFIMTSDGAEFFAYLPNMFPRGSERRPGTADELRRAMDRPEVMIDPQRLDEAARDGAQMSGRLSQINSLLELRRSGSPEERQRAERELNATLTPWGMTLASVDALLSRESKTRLDVTDMADLRRDDWVRRGVAVRFRDVVVETFLLDAGLQFRRGEGAAAFLTGNTDVFVALWQMVQQGSLPVVYIDDAITALSREGVLAGLRSQMAGGRTLESLIMENLTASNLYFSTAVLQNSFLGRLDSRASLDPQFRQVFEALLLRYRGNTAALEAFNRFAILDTEEMYGDMNELATLIVANPQNALELARQRGFVGLATLASMDPSIRTFPAAEQTAIVRFVRDHSDAQHGVLRWIEAHRSNIGSNLGNILRDLVSTEAVAGMGNAQLYTENDANSYLERQADRFKTRGWWRGQTPSQVAAERERARQRAPQPPGGQQGQRRPQTREEMRREEETPRPVRRPGFEAATPTRTDQQPAAPVVIQLTPQAEAFYASERGQMLGLMLDGLLASMYEDARGDGAILREIYGEPTRDADNNTVAPEQARLEIRADVFRMLTSTSPADATIRRGWGITVSGTNDSMRVEIDMRRARDPLRSRIRQYAIGRRQQPREGQR